MAGLTATEARTRSASVAVTAYDVTLDLTGGAHTFLSRSVIEFDSRDHQDTFVDIQPDRLLSVHLNDVTVDPALLRDGRLPLTDMADTNVLVVEARMSYSHDGEGLHRAVDPEDGLAYVYAMTFLPAARRVFACFDQPDLKATYRVTVKAPPEWVVLGNGRATQTAPGLWTLDETPPLATYFVTVVAGPYHSIKDDHDGITLGLHCRQSLAPHLDKDRDELFTVTGQCFDEYHRLFGIRYPFGDYHQVFVPEFNAGAMENPGCVTFTDDLVFRAQASDSLRASRTNIIAHEMAHQWFGDLVTMRWWDDLWLNESFAEYMGYRVTSSMTGFDDVYVEYAHVTKAWGMAADQRRSTHPVAVNGARDVEQALTDFDGISYSKGAAVLRQLNAYLGDDAFLTGVVDHLQRHAYGNASLADLLESWQRASARDVTAWAQAWLRTSGLDTLSCVADEVHGVTVERTNGSIGRVSRPHALTVTWYRDDATSHSAPVLLTGERARVELASYDGTGLLLPDSADQTWAKIRLGAMSGRRAPGLLATIDDPLGRAVIWGALRESLLDAACDPADYLTTVEGALHGESDLAAEKILEWATRGLGTYFGVAGDRQRLAGVAAALLHDASPASNRQLVAARALVALTRDVDLLRGWLDSDAPEGLLIDADLRWRVTRSLCELAAFTLVDVDAESRRDPSSQGAEHALRCKAVIPDPDVKAEVWAAITTDGSLGNYSLYALAECFFRPDQSELTRQYVERYFVDIPRSAKMRTGWVVGATAKLAFPRFAVDPDTIRLGEECLRAPELDPGTRRAVSDSTDDLMRTLASRRAYPRTDHDDGR